MLQHGAYTLLIDACYDREQFPTLEQAIEWTWAVTDEEIAAVKFVLSRFFSLNNEGQYIQNRILEEILTYHKNAETNKRIAIEREQKRKENSTNRVQTVNEPPPNHKPLTNNHKPTNNKKNRSSKMTDPLFEEFWDAFADKRARGGAEKAWKRINPDPELAQQIIDGANRYTQNIRPPEKRYWKMAQGWLNEQRWMDEDEPATVGDDMLLNWEKYT